MSIITRTCGSCKVEQPIGNFYIEAEARASARQGKKRKMPCRQCQREYQQKRRAPRQEYVDKLKAERGCMDCGLHPEYSQVLEFDHRPDENKLFHISDGMVNGTMERLITEIAKCDIVCANCHRVRTVIKNQFGQDFGAKRVRMGQVNKDRLAGLGHIWDNADIASESTSKFPGQDELDLFAA